MFRFLPKSGWWQRSDRDLQLLLERSTSECEVAGMKISPSKSKRWKRPELFLWVGYKVLPKVEEFKYLRVMFRNDPWVSGLVLIGVAINTNPPVDCQTNHQVDWCGMCSNANNVLICHEERAEQKSRALNLPVELRSYPHLWWQALDQWCPKEVLEGRQPTCFSSLPGLKNLDQMMAR